MKLFAWMSVISMLGLAGCGGGGAAGPLDDVKAVVVNSLGEDISVIGTGDPPEVIKSMVTVGSAPNQILVRGKEALVLSSTSNSLQVIDLESWEVVREYGLGDGCNPFWMAPAPDDLLVITCWLSNELLLVDPDVDMRQEPVLKKLAMPEGADLKPFDPGAPSHARPQGVAVVGHTAYVTLTNLGDDFFTAGPGLVLVVDVAAWTKDKIIELPNTNPVSIHTSGTSGDRLHVSCTGAWDGTGTIETIDPGTRSHAATVAIGAAPGRMWIDEQGIAWVGDNLEGQVLTYDTASGEVGDPIVLCPSDFENQVFNFIADVATDGRGNVYAACFATDEVCVFSAGGDGADKRCYEVGDGPTALLVVQR